MVSFALGVDGAVLAAGQARLVTHASGAARTIALTFDDGWHSGRCSEIFDTLVRFDVPATWFPNAVYMGSAPGLWRRIARRFPIANHTTHHVSLPGRSAQKIRKEISSEERRIEAITGRPLSKLLRPPYGAYDGRVLREARRLGYNTVVLWDVSANDTSPRATDRGVARAALRGKPGSIVLMHCGPEVTPRVLPIIIARYACAGFRFATVEALLAGGRGVKAKADCPAPPLPSAGRQTVAASPETGTTEHDPLEDVAGDWRLTDALRDDGLLPVPPDVVLTLHFDPKQVSGLVDCDVYAARSTVRPDGALRFKRLVRSYDACDPPHDQSTGYLDVLMAAVGQRIVEEGLELLDPHGQAVLRFTQAIPAGLLGGWAATAIIDKSGALASVEGDSPQIVRFGPTGTISGSTACSSYRGGYSTAGAAITAGPLLTGLVSCDDDAAGSGGRFLAALRSVAGWSLREGSLELRDPSNTIVLELERTPSS